MSKDDYVSWQWIVAVVAIRSESRAAPRAIATVIFSFCFFVMPVFVCRTADRHTRATLRKKGKHSQAHAGVTVQ